MTAKMEFSRKFGLHQGWSRLSMLMIVALTPIMMLDWGLTTGQIGIVYATMSTSVILSELPGGILSDRFGRKNLYLVSITFCCISTLTFLVWQNFTGAMVGMGLWGVAIAMNSGTLESWYVERFSTLSGDSDLQVGLAKVTQVAGLFSSIGIGLLSILALVTSTFFSDLNTDSIIIASLVSYVAHFVFSVWWIDEPKPVRQPENDGDQNVNPLAKLSTWKLVKNPVVFRLLIVSLLIVPVGSAMEKYWPILIENAATLSGVALSMKDSGLWVLYALFASTQLLIAVAQKFSVKLVKAFGGQLGKAAFVSLVLQVIFVMIMVASPNLWVFVAAWLVYFGTLGLKISITGKLLHNNIPDYARSTMVSLSSLFQRTGGMMGSLSAGFGVLYSSWFFVFLVLCLWALLSIVVYLNSEMNQVVVKPVAV